MEEYKAGQGSLTRLITWMLLLIAAFLGCVEFYSWFHYLWPAPLLKWEWFRDLPFFHVPFSGMFLVTTAMFLAIVWGLRRFLRRPKTVDTLIETEQEMKKVSWPTREESLNATWVVLLVTIVMTLSLWLFDGGLRLVLSLVF